METSSTIATHLAAVRRRIIEACAATSRNPNQIRLIAVSKFHQPPLIREAFQEGCLDFGENYAQELFQKAEDLADLKLRWHFIGKVQSNKLRRLARVCDSIQGIAKWDHARMLNEICESEGLNPIKIFLSVREDGDDAKSGFLLHEIPTLVTRVRNDLPHVSLQGLFTIPSFTTSHSSSLQNIPTFYRQLSELTKDLDLPQLSLGMSQDLEAAVAAGSTMVRIGTAIFGPRPAAL